MLSGKYLNLYHKIKSIIPEKNLIHDETRLLAFAADASFYRLLPKLVIKVENESEVMRVLKECSQLNIPVTFRAAGTSLSGQSISDSVLMVATKGWKKYRIDKNFDKISLQPGVIGEFANKLLAIKNKKIGPDPASINSAMIGGIAANNASGMCCGVAQNSYQTLAAMRIIFADGTMLDTGDLTSVQKFKSTHSELIQAVEKLAKEINQNKELTERIRFKYKMKNTTGYSLNSLVDFDDPIDIIQHLLIGSEGTLGFIAEITYKTVPDLPCKASSLMIFPNVFSACQATTLLKTTPVDAVELMDRASLRSVENQDGMPSFLKNLSDDCAAILVETRAKTESNLKNQIKQIKLAIPHIPTVLPIEFTSVKEEYEKLWKIRKGLFPSVGAMRETGTTVIIEDVAFPIKHLAQATLDIQCLLKKHGYQDAIIFGHALEGNLHFVFKQNFNVQEELERYQNLMYDVVKLVVDKYDGSLKAEHGTGRNMAPFVELEWGKEAFRLMQRIKQIFDPNGILNPGVILNPDDKIHLKNLKPLPPGHLIIDKCIECGFCEPDCVSRDLTLSPRQRITVYREISRLAATGKEPHRLAQLRSDFNYLGNQTCATDGLCELSCPVNINTGTLIKELRNIELTARKKKIGSWISRHMGLVTHTGRLALNFVDLVHRVVGTKAMLKISWGLWKISANKLPLWNPFMPVAADRIRPDSGRSAGRSSVVYFPSCINRTMGASRDYPEKISLTKKTEQLLKKAGFWIIYPENLDNLCCGMAFFSKGHVESGRQKATELEQALLQASNSGEIPILCDMSPCLFQMKESLSGKLKLHEPIEFILNFVSDKLKFHKLNETVALHVTCSTKKMGLEENMIQLAQMCAEKVVVPEGNCCGFAGDRGFTYPELNHAGLETLKEQIPANCNSGYSTSRTCEIGLSLHGEFTFQSIIYLIDRCTSAKN